MKKKVLIFLMIICFSLTGMCLASIISKPVRPQPSINQVAQSVRVMNYQAYQAISQYLSQIYSYINNNPEGYTADQILNSLNADAGPMLTIFSQLQSACKIADPNYNALVPVDNYQINPDNTLTDTTTNQVLNGS